MVDQSSLAARGRMARCCAEVIEFRTIPEHGKLLAKVTRREFLKTSAAIAAGIAASNSAGAGAPADPQSEALLYLPPLLSCPTETSIRISALNDKGAAEAVIE